jgi:hypothetical protein
MGESFRIHTRRIPFYRPNIWERLGEIFSTTAWYGLFDLLSLTTTDQKAAQGQPPLIQVGKRIKTHNLPSLGRNKGSASNPSKNKSHDPADFEEREFKLVKDAPILDVGNSPVWGLEQEIASGWSSESQIQTYVHVVLSEIIEMAGLGGVISCQNEMSVYEIRYRLLATI